MLKIKNLFLKKDNFILGKISFEIEKNSYCVILGKTGSGKTMLLESIAGIQNPEGNLYFDGKDISNISPNKRDFGFVYQDFALFPNMSVEKNIKFSARYKKIEDEKNLFLDLIEFLQIKDILKRDIKYLSGGEKQRVAIARAIYSRPKLLLLDEPLSAVDPTFRNSIMKSLKEIVQRYNTTIIHVTHNFREASYLADKIAVMLDGQILQIGDAKDVLNSPSSIEVAKFLGFKNIFSTKILGFEQKNKFFSIDPNKIDFLKEKCLDDYCFECKIEKIMGITDHYKIFATVKDTQSFFAKIPKQIFMELKLNEGDKSYIFINKKDVVFI